ncbi:MAG: trypsin-like peptidase domain-containing protein [Oscillospiraceae bacterium]
MKDYYESDSEIFPSGSDAPVMAEADSPYTKAPSETPEVYSCQFGSEQTERDAIKAQKKEKRRDRRPGIGLVAVCVLLSFCAGFGGSYLSNAVFPQKQSVVYQSAGALNSNSDGSSSFADVVALASDSVVEITTETVTTGNYFGQSVQQGAGSGVVLSADGYIVTNNHVVNGASKITVRTKSGANYPATLVGTDSKTDLAVLKIDATGLTPTILGDSSKLRVGDAVVAIGNPLGSLGGTVTDGIISALDREIVVQNQTMTLLQTSAAVNPGNSGGGLFNANGELVGIVNAKSMGSDIEGLGFAISVNTVKDVTREIMENGYVSGRVVLGVTIATMTDEDIKNQPQFTRAGVYVLGVTEGYGADKAGIKEGDYIVSVDDNVVLKTSDLTSLLDDYSVGDEISVQLIRDNKTMTVTVKLMESVPEAKS